MFSAFLGPTVEAITILVIVAFALPFGFIQETGTVVWYGRGREAVVATGMRTEVRRIAELLEAVEPERTPLAGGPGGNQ